MDLCHWKILKLKRTHQSRYTEKNFNPAAKREKSKRCMVMTVLLVLIQVLCFYRHKKVQERKENAYCPQKHHLYRLLSNLTVLLLLTTASFNVCKNRPN